MFRHMPLDGVIDTFLSVFNAVFFALAIIATQVLFDAIAVAAGGGMSFAECVRPLLILGGVTFGQQIMNGLHNFHGGSVMWLKARGVFGAILQQKLQRIDPANFEDVEFQDNLNKAKEGYAALCMFAFIPIFIVTFYGTYFATVGVYLFSLKPILLAVIMLAFIPAMLAQIVRAKVFTKLEAESAPLRREHEYYQRTLTDREYLKETRILGAFNFFHRLFMESLSLLVKKTWQAERKTALLQLVLNVTSFAGMAVATYLLFTATMAGEISVGAFAAVFAALGQIFYVMQEIITQHIGGMNRDIGKVENYIRMLDMPEWTGDFAVPDYALGVVAEDVSFTYPGRDNAAVDGVSLTIAAGETIAIVGENGAGKSTLVRLLCGIYRPSAGTVTAGGIGTAESAQASLYRRMSGVFQKYQRYKMTLSENVVISDVGALPHDRQRHHATADDGRINAALKEAEFDTSDVPLDTMLSPEFGGIDLSGGLWQRLAIARGLYRTSRFIVLDEPTAAIDPIEETRVYTQFQRLAAGKCAVVVTHRLGSAKLADRVVVMDGGKIVATGTHDELVTRPGKYAEMWAAQAKWYG